MNLLELFDFQQSTPAGTPENLYALAIRLYLQGELPGLEKAQAIVNERTGPLWEFVDSLIQLRIQIRKRSLELKIFQQHLMNLERLSPLVPEGWTGEAKILIGMGYEIFEDHTKSRDYYFTASKILNRCGLHRKAVKALHNSIAAESRLHPEKKLFVEYHLVHRKAKKVREFGIAGLALVNISREYQRMGAFLAALKYCNRGLKYLEHEVGTLPYYLGLLQRCHLHLDLWRNEEAKTDFEMALCAPFREIRSALEVLKSAMVNQAASTEPPRFLTPSWNERLADFKKGEKEESLSHLETELLYYIGESPRSKQEIIDRLYGNRLIPEAAENRLRVLVARLRKKRPGLIVTKLGQYGISEDFFPLQLSNRVPIEEKAVGQ